MIDRSQLRVGMRVEGPAGEALGRIKALEPETFIVEKGLVFKKDRVVPLDAVADVQGDRVRLALGEAALGPSANADPPREASPQRGLDTGDQPYQPGSLHLPE